MTLLLDRIAGALNGVLDWGVRSIWRQIALIALAGFLTIVPGLTALPVTDRDEGRFVQASKQMIETGDLVDIRFQDQPRWKKPVGIYWLQAASATVFGGVDAPIWAYRLPSALAAFMAALLTVWAARPLIGPRGALLAGLMTVTTLLLAVEANIAKTDATLLATAMAAMGAMAQLIFGQGGRGTALIFWLAIAGAILIKGPIVPVIAILALAWYGLATREMPPLRRFYPVPGVILTAVLVAPWLIAIWQVSGGAFFEEALGRDLGAKLTSGQEKHWGPPGLYLGIVWGTFWPWAALLILAAAWLWQNRRADWLRFLAGWVIPFWIMLEVVPTKLPHYVLPLYPALAIALAGWVLSDGHDSARWQKRATAFMTALPPVGLALGIIVLPVALEGTVAWVALPLGLIAAGSAVLAFRAAWTGRVMAQIGASLIAALAIYPAVLHFGLPMLATAFPSPRMAEVIAQYRPCAEGPPYSVGYHEPSLVFLTETGIRMADAEGAMKALRTMPGTLVLIDDRWRANLGDKVPANAVTRDRLRYFNYNRGKMESADLLSMEDPRWDDCLP